MTSSRSACQLVCRYLIQDAMQILLQQRGLSSDEAHECLYELAQANKLFVIEVAERILQGQLVLADRRERGEGEVLAADSRVVTLINDPNGGTMIR